MPEFLLDPVTGDLDISKGIQTIQLPDQEAAQRLKLALDLNLGEFFANKNHGLPYIKNPEETYNQNIRFMLGDKFPDSERFVYNTITDYIEGLSFIRSVTATYTFNRKTRVMDYKPVCIYQDGTTIEFQPFIIEI